MAPIRREKKNTLGLRTTERIRLVATRSAEYFCCHGREFPWRRERNPYRLAIAEILLQKTRADSVVETYQRLMRTYPAPSSLAVADIEHLQTILTPLGLSRKRALQLCNMAFAVLDIGEAALSDWRVLLADVPGLGAYAARAIACFGADEPIGIVDANVARIIRRVFRIKTRDPRAVVYQRYADAVAQSSNSVRETNFGLLDLGAAVCVARPKCEACPLSEFCPRYGVRR